MPLQTVFYSKVNAIGTVLLHPLGTRRIEGDKIYKYVKVGGTVAADAALDHTGQGTVVLFTGIGPGAGFNQTGSALAANDYFWMQIHGEVGGLDTDTGMTAVGYPVGVTDADGVTLEDPGAGVSIFGNTVVAVKHATLGIIYLSGLA